MPIRHARHHHMTAPHIHGDSTLEMYLNMCCLLQAIARRAQPIYALLTSPPTRTASIIDELYKSSHVRILPPMPEADSQYPWSFNEA